MIATPKNMIQPAWEWKPCEAMSGEKCAPRLIKAAIRAEFATQMASAPIGKTRST